MSKQKYLVILKELSDLHDPTVVFPASVFSEHHLNVLAKPNSHNLHYKANVT